MNELNLDDVEMPSDAGEPWGEAETEPLDLDQSLEEALPADEADFDDVFTVQNTDVANFDESNLTTTAEVAEYIEEHIPAEHLSGLDTIEYVNDQSAYDQGLMGMWESDPWTGTVAIEVYPHDDEGVLYDTIAHEIGHNAEETLPGEVVDQWNELYAASLDDVVTSGGEQFPFVSDYAMSSAEEDFAETYSFYINDPELVRAVCPDKYDFMQAYVFGGREFSPRTVR